MTMRLKFSHKVLLAASLVVIAAFCLFVLYSNYLQRNAIRTNLEHYLEDMGKVTAHTCSCGCLDASCLSRALPARCRGIMRQPI